MNVQLKLIQHCKSTILQEKVVCFEKNFVNALKEKERNLWAIFKMFMLCDSATPLLSK